MTGKGSSVREEVLLAAARAVLATLREPMEKKTLPKQAVASLRVLETALEHYPDSDW